MFERSTQQLREISIVAPRAHEQGEEKAGETSAEGLRQELERARRERDDFEAQYKGLLGKLTQMRSTLGERLRQDAVRTSLGSLLRARPKF